MQLVNLIIAVLSLSVIATAFMVARKIRDLKSRVITQRRASIQKVIGAIGEIESLREAKSRARVIEGLMKENGLVALIIPLKSGGRVGFRVN
jgi:hypothetical protein